MATKSIRDTGIVAVVDVGPMPLPRKGGARLGGIDIRPGKVAIHAGETEADARAFAEIIRASYAAHPQSLGKPTGKDATGVRRKPGAGWFDVRGYSTTRSDGLTEHRCADGTQRKIRARYLTGGVGSRAECPRCTTISEPPRASVERGPCGTCGGSWHVSHYPGAAGMAHDYVPAPLAYTVPELRMVDVPRILPADLYLPIDWSGTPPRTPPAPRKADPAARKVAPRAPRKATPRTARKPLPAAPSPVAAAVAARAIVASAAPLGPCPRCARTDWQTVKGRAWHLENNPDCAKWRNPAKHAYAA